MSREYVLRVDAATVVEIFSALTERHAQLSRVGRLDPSFERATTRIREQLGAQGALDELAAWYGHTPTERSA